jgi:hypothetical protein
MGVLQAGKSSDAAAGSATTAAGAGTSAIAVAAAAVTAATVRRRSNSSSSSARCKRHLSVEGAAVMGPIAAYMCSYSTMCEPATGYGLLQLQAVVTAAITTTESQHYV